eukprot:3720713-Rhodomonas_salina.1
MARFSAHHVQHSTAHVSTALRTAYRIHTCRARCACRPPPLLSAPPPILSALPPFLSANRYDFSTAARSGSEVAITGAGAAKMG